MALYKVVLGISAVLTGVTLYRGWYAMYCLIIRISGTRPLFAYRKLTNLRTGNIYSSCSYCIISGPVVGGVQ